jgi:hypothetical protein
VRVLWIAAIALGVALLVIEVTRDHVSGDTPTQVLVAKRLIPKGTPGSLISSHKLYARTTLPRSEVSLEFISDRQYLVGRAASSDILPGQQLTALDFSTK